MRRLPAYPVAFFLFSILFSGPAVVGVGSGRLLAQEGSYQEMRAEVVELYGNGRFSEAADILTEALELYPDHLEANCVNLALMHLRMENLEGSLEAVQYGLDHGIWFGKYTFMDPTWDPMKEHSGWAPLEARNEEARAQAALHVQPRLEVSLPQGYDPARRYPLFLALHGGGENVDLFMPNWTSPLLSREFIVAFPQSTQLIAMDGYNWTEDVERSLAEIREAYEEVVGAYPVDEDQVIVGGFSSGGFASLEVVLEDALPVRGFVVLCPPVPEDLTVERAAAAAARGVRGTLLTTEMDGRLEQQRHIVGIMDEANLPLEFHVTPDVGHWYPDDLPERIDRAIAHIRGEG